MSKVDIVVTEEIAKKAIQDPINNFVQVKTIQLFGQGFDNFVFLVNDIFLFRFPKNLESQDLMRGENKITPEIQEIVPIKIPNIVYFGKPTSIYPFYCSCPENPGFSKPGMNGLKTLNKSFGF